MTAITFSSAIFLCFQCLIIPSPALFAQGLPETDIFVARISHVNSRIVLDSLHNITHRSGYDNQPSFVPDGKSILFTEYLDNQSDIFRYFFENDSIVRLTDTKESEYSPVVMPDGKHFSVVRVEKDSTQRIWQFPLALQGSSESPELLLKTIKPVGYQEWIDSATIALFILGDTNMLHIVRIQSENDEKVVGEIGRSLHKIPGGNSVSFVHKASEKEWWIKAYDPKTKTLQPLIQTLPKREDFTWTQDGMLLMGDSLKLYSCKPRTDSTWQLLADFSGMGISEISRLAVCLQGDRVAIVGRMVTKR